jgi:hypothetical protein
LASAPVGSTAEDGQQKITVLDGQQKITVLDGWCWLSVGVRPAGWPTGVLWMLLALVRAVGSGRKLVVRACPNMSASLFKERTWRVPLFQPHLVC